MLNYDLVPAWLNKPFLVESLSSRTCWCTEQETFGKHQNVSKENQRKFLNMILDFSNSYTGNNFQVALKHNKEKRAYSYCAS